MLTLELWFINAEFRKYKKDRRLPFSMDAKKDKRNMLQYWYLWYKPENCWLKDNIDKYPNGYTP